MSKPFIAARIPQKIADKLDEHSQESGKGKTEIIVNALAEYLGCVIDVPEETHAIDRLVAVEKELVELRSRIAAIEEPTKLAIPRQLPLDNTFVNENDGQLNSQEKTSEEVTQRSDNEIESKDDNTMHVPSTEAAKLLGISRPTLDYQVQKGKLPFTRNGYTLIAKIGNRKSAHGKPCVMWEIKKLITT